MCSYIYHILVVYKQLFESINFHVPNPLNVVCKEIRKNTKHDDDMTTNGLRFITVVNETTSISTMATRRIAYVVIEYRLCTKML